MGNALGIRPFWSFFVYLRRSQKVLGEICPKKDTGLRSKAESTWNCLKKNQAWNVFLKNVSYVLYVYLCMYVCFYLSIYYVNWWNPPRVSVTLGKAYPLWSGFCRGPGHYWMACQFFLANITVVVLKCSQTKQIIFGINSTFYQTPTKTLVVFIKVTMKGCLLTIE